MPIKSSTGKQFTLQSKNESRTMKYKNYSLAKMRIHLFLPTLSLPLGLPVCLLLPLDLSLEDDLETIG